MPKERQKNSLPIVSVHVVYPKSVVNDIFLLFLIAFLLIRYLLLVF